MSLDVFEFVLFTSVLLMVYFVPYTKVEESFNLQATHDFLYHTTDLPKYDHLEFPGVVPRTFLGALSLSVVSSPLVWFLNVTDSPKIFSQYAVRMVLGFALWVSWVHLTRAAQSVWGPNVRYFASLLLLCQFHLPFYFSRPLPNVFALFLVNFAFSFWIQNRLRWTISLMTATAAIFRSETIILFGPMMLVELAPSMTSWSGWKKIFSYILHGLLSLAVSVAVTVAIDSVMWDRWLWPEGEVFWFNTIQNKSHIWGTSPFHWYFTSALPKALLGSLPLALYGIYSDRRTWKYVSAIVLFVTIYSFLPHKELRFIFYAIPFLTICAAIGFDRIFRNRKKSRRPYFLACYMITLSFFLSICFFIPSLHNYPGGEALNRIHHLSLPTDSKIHIDVATAVSGASRFGQLSSTFSYNKAEDLQDFSGFDVLLTEKQPSEFADSFDLVEPVQGFSRIIEELPFVLLEDKLFILRRKKTSH